MAAESHPEKELVRLRMENANLRAALATLAVRVRRASEAGRIGELESIAEAAEKAVE